MAKGFLEGSAPALPKNFFGTSGDVPPSIAKNFSAHQEMHLKVSSTLVGSGSCSTKKFRLGNSRALQIFAE
jgi:hypothetical protein